ncbi:uncharacterized protein FOMMEDRAFT_137600 [Fomitiporia mediterranea MF3/22]|uniref:mRNA 3'-end-processing protein n=1 Tax=Fomitiporia mediterranea (strain MF3/22) TaxID=694068 RepID=R7SGN9_FOMME|nr:uncharacterized protein FOMMEDRAFT_137600 [Fomitiporia mediterranea MF3/22]EJC97472.1 hypothetical protein FOMMEDRAFT_137600 [Fomitiporia mediterranea MF3/22]
MTMQDPLAGASTLKDIVRPQFHQVSLSADNFVKYTIGVKLDKDDQICRLALTPAGCPLGPLQCPLRHTNPSPQNFQPPKQVSMHPRDRKRLATVCKHWLRGLCKKGDACEFLHEYNLRRMPECWWYAKFGYCQAGDECLYAHPKEKKIECPDYKRGFCKLGTCSFFNVNIILNSFRTSLPSKTRQTGCMQNYLTGYCPLKQEYTRGHPKPDLPTPKDYEPPEAPSQRDLDPPPPGYGRYTGFDRNANL